MRYRLFITMEVRDFIKALRPGPRRLLEKRLKLIHQSPLEFSNGQTTDASNRPIEIHTFRDYKIYYWVDDPDGDLKITNIKKASGRRYS